MRVPYPKLRFALPATLIALVIVALTLVPVSRARNQQRAVQRMAASDLGFPLGHAEVNPYRAAETAWCGGMWTDNSLWSHLHHNVRKLYPQGVDLGDEMVVRDLESLTFLEELSIDQCKVPAGALAKVHWDRLPELRTLTVGSTPLSVDDWRALRRISKLDMLLIDEVPLSGDALKAIGSLQTLTVLGLNHCGLSDDSLVHLQHLRRLEGLGLRGNDLTDEGLRHLAGLKRLQVLSLSGDYRTPMLTPQGMLMLHSRNARITGRAATTLAQLPELRQLDLSWTTFDDEGVSQLDPLRRLESLKLDGAAVSDRSLALFCDFANLFTVSLCATPVTSGGIQAMEREHSEWSFDYDTLSRPRMD